MDAHKHNYTRREKDPAGRKRPLFLINKLKLLLFMLNILPIIKNLFNAI
jgi:hypothetical protein